MEYSLKDFPDYITAVVEIHEDVMHDRFESLVQKGLAKPSTPMEYRSRLNELLMGRKVTNIPKEVLENGYVFKDETTSSPLYSIEIPFYVDNAESEIFGIFRLCENNNNTGIYLYDILIP